LWAFLLPFLIQIQPKIIDRIFLLPTKTKGQKKDYAEIATNNLLMNRVIKNHFRGLKFAAIVINHILGKKSIK